MLRPFRFRPPDVRTAFRCLDSLSLVEGKYSEEKAAKLQREKELAKVVIRKEDVDLIVEEMEIPRSAAERSLREHKGDVVEALVSLTN